jgi:hypothetical protein
MLLNTNARASECTVESAVVVEQGSTARMFRVNKVCHVREESMENVRSSPQH